MLSNKEPCENSDKSYSAEDEEDGTDPICNQQRGRKRREWKRNNKNKRQNFKEWNSPPVIRKLTKPYA